MKVKTGNSLDNEMSLWRYMSIDKLIDLLSTEQLRLTPLETYQDSSDPFEGFMPKVAFKALQSVYFERLDELASLQVQSKHNYEKMVAAGLVQSTATKANRINELREKIEGAKESSISASIKISKSTCVNCWYHSESESEAMWKLYSDSGKGIAIKTSVSSLVKALDSCSPNVHLWLSRVKYLDFFSDDLKPKDCVVDGHIIPLLKRKEFEHENEVRLFTVPNLDPKKWSSHKPAPIKVDVDISTLIESLYISPYAKEPFISSVSKLCELWGVPKERVIKSPLLDSYEAKLINLFR
jgi:hypothetical protein